MRQDSIGPRSETVPTAGEMTIRRRQDQRTNGGKEKAMFTKVFTRTLWTALFAAVMTGYVAAVARLAGVEI